MATFLLGDCLDLMKSMPDKSVDCFICDLPYGCLSSNPNNKRKRFIGGVDTGTMLEGQTIGGCEWDIKIDLVEFWKQVKRLCKDSHTPVLMFCNTKFGIDLINSNPSWFRYDLVWDKGRGVSFLLSNKQPLKSHEMIYVFSKAGAFYNRIDIKTEKGVWVRDRRKETKPKSVHYGIGMSNDLETGGKDGMRCPVSVIPIPGKTVRGGHPTQKPEDLYRWLLSRYCPTGGTVLDPTAGSFNACFVARELGLKAIGMEKDRGFFYKAVARLLKLRTSNPDIIEHV